MRQPNVRIRLVPAVPALLTVCLVSAACASSSKKTDATPNPMSARDSVQGAKQTAAYSTPTSNGRRTSSKISQEEIERAGDMNIAAFIESHLAGVRVTQARNDYVVYIAGAMDRTEGALILIDGTEGSLAAVNLRDVKSIELLKDGAASVYGVRGGRGVLMITMRKQ